MNGGERQGQELQRLVCPFNALSSHLCRPVDWSSQDLITWPKLSREMKSEKPERERTKRIRRLTICHAHMPTDQSGGFCILRGPDKANAEHSAEDIYICNTFKTAALRARDCLPPQCPSASRDSDRKTPPPQNSRDYLKLSLPNGMSHGVIISLLALRAT